MPSGSGEAFRYRRYRGGQLWNVFARIREDLGRTGRATRGGLCGRLRCVIEPRRVLSVTASSTSLRTSACASYTWFTTLAAPGPRAPLFADDIGQRMHRWPFPLDFDRR
jgi:hypothetical protein